MDETKTVFKIYLYTPVSIIYLQGEFKNDTSSLLHNERVVQINMKHTGRGKGLIFTCFKFF